jgi:O-methyltransferase
MAHRIDYVQGWFADSLPGPIGPLAILRCDGDMYSSTTQTLTALYPHLSPGGYCVIDDYAGTDTRGADRAVHDYRTAHTVTEPIRQGDQRAAAWRHDA